MSFLVHIWPFMTRCDYKSPNDFLFASPQYLLLTLGSDFAD
jgi:hypothetical protein